MIVSASAVLLLGLVIGLLIRIRYLRWPDVLLCTAFGFLLAASAAAPLVQGVLDGIGGFLGEIYL